MRLYFIRHGKAVSAESALADGDRPLSGEGRRQILHLSGRMHRLGVHWGLIVTSPLARARETAEMLQGAGLAPRVEASAVLAPAGELPSWLPFLAKWRDSRRGDLAAVGHFPNLSVWAGSLVWGDARDRLVFKPAGVIGLEVPESGTLLGNCQLFWLTSPAFLV